MNYELEPALLWLIHNLVMNQYLFLWLIHNLLIPDELAKARSPTRADRPSLPPEAKAVSAQFADFLKTRVKSVGITDLSRNIQSFIDKVGLLSSRSIFSIKSLKVHKRVDTLPIEQVSVMVQNFYQVDSKFYARLYRLKTCTWPGAQ